MKILAFGDIHMATAEASSIPDLDQADLILLTGDLTNYGGEKEAKKVLDEIMRLNPNVLALFGNLDRQDINEYLENLGINLHGQARLVQGKVCIAGVGGSNPTPFGTPSEFSEQEIAQVAERAFRQGEEFISLAQPLHRRKIPLIFVSHSPPYQTRLDRLQNGKHVGSRAVRAAIEKYQPALCITGHIHESKGEDSINNTPVYNPGMLKRGGWLTIHLDQSQIKASLQ